METQPNTNGGLFKRIAAVMGEIRSLPKDGFNSQSNYNYVSSDTALDKIGKAMAAHGVVVIPMMMGYEAEDVQRGNSIRTRVKASFQMHICDSDGNAFLCPWFAEGIDYGSPDRALNKAMTNATKYFLLKLFIVGAGGEDPDGEAVEEKKPEPARQAKPQAAKPKPAQAAKPGEAAATERKNAPLISELQYTNLHELGRSLYGDKWNEKRPSLVRAVTNGATESSKELTQIEAGKLLDGMAKQVRENERKKAAA